MTNVEIFHLVREKKQKIEDIFDPTSFVLNPEVVKLEEEISELQTQCEHDFVCGVGKYCSLEEK